jgi:hypothetical protein
MPRATRRLFALFLGVTLLVGAAMGAWFVAGSGAQAADPPFRWVALGDSYSAGTGSALPLPNCQRSGTAYATLLRDAMGSLVSSFNFQACSGAPTSAIWNKQLPAVLADTNLVTVTAGGDDLDFAGLIFHCVVAGSCPGWFRSLANQNPTVTPQANDGTGTGWDILFGRLVGLYEQIRKQMQPSGDLYVLSYPIPFGNPDRWPIAARTLDWCSGVDKKTAIEANVFASRLDDTIYQATQATDARLNHDGITGNVHFVDWRSGSKETVNSVGGGAYPVSPNGLCGDPGADQWLNSLTTVYPNMFHPTPTGYYAAAVRLANAIGQSMSAAPFPIETLPALPPSQLDTLPTLPTVPTTPATSRPPPQPTIRPQPPVVSPTNPVGTVPTPAPTAPTAVATTPTTKRTPKPRPRHPVVLYDTLSAPNLGYGSCSGELGDPRGGSPGGRFVQTFVVPAGVTSITDVTIPRSQWLDFEVSIYRGDTEVGVGVVPRGQDWQQIDVAVGNVRVTPGEQLQLASENPSGPTGIGFWQARTTSDAYPRGGLTAYNPCPWSQTAHPAVDQNNLDLVARIDGLGT